MAAVKLTNEDDFISPSQSCINPLFTSDRKVDGKSELISTEQKEKAIDSNETITSTERKRKAVRRRRIPLELKLEQEITDINNQGIANDLSIGGEMMEPPSTKATLSVADCLACSGCITSAEAVLVTTKHSIDTLQEQCSEHSGKTIVFTISPAVIADMTRTLTKYWDHTQYGMLTSRILYQRLANFLKKTFHAKIILDGSLPQRISLLESGIEFCHRYRALQMSSEKEAKREHTVLPLQPMKNTPSIDTRISLETPSISLSATQTRFLIRRNMDPKAELEGIEIEHDGGIDTRLSFLQNSSSVENPSHVLPMMSSSCPGFVCYVEKTVPSLIPNLCTSKSPMAIAGSIFKHDLLEKIQAQEQFGIPSHIIEQTKEMKDTADFVYHVAIMPCYDKGLEANRKDLAWLKYQQQQEVLTPDVDLVITSNQLLSVLAGIDSESSDKNREELACKVLMSQTMNVNTSSVVTCNHEMEPSQSETRGSGSYAEFIFRFASFVLFGYRIEPTVKLPWKSSNMSRMSNSGVPQRRVRSKVNENRISDSMEVSLYRLQDGTYSLMGDPSVDEVLLRFSTCYGFRNIQLLMQQLSSNTTRQGDISHFVEVMACPGGCINGGGLAKASSVMKGLREKPSEMRQRIENTRVHLCDSTDWISGDAMINMSNDVMCLTHTRFHVVPQLELSTGATAGVKIDDTQW